MKPDTPSKRELILLFGMPRSGTTWIGKESLVRRLAWPWILYNQKAMNDIDTMNRATMVRYDGLCATPQQGFRPLFDFCDLDWNRQTDQFLDASTQQTRGGYYSVYKDPLASANKWQEELDSEDAATIRALAMEHPIGAWFFSTGRTA